METGGWDLLVLVCYNSGARRVEVGHRTASRHPLNALFVRTMCIEQSVSPSPLRSDERRNRSAASSCDNNVRDIYRYEHRPFFCAQRILSVVLVTELVGEGFSRRFEDSEGCFHVYWKDFNE